MYSADGAHSAKSSRDNGKPFIAVLVHLEKKYHIKHIQISGYNLCANGIIKYLHFDIWQALYKATDGDQSKWSQAVMSVFWSERITLCKRISCVPYYMVTGTHPLLSFNIIEVNYLQLLLDSLLTTTDLIARRAIALQKQCTDLKHLCDRIHHAHNQAAIQFKCDHFATIRNFNFARSALILVHNTTIEKALNRKMCLCYTGPLVVISRNHSGTYILCELDGALAHSPFAAFRVIPYFVRFHIEVPDLKQHLDVNVARLHKMEATTVADLELNRAHDSDDNNTDHNLAIYAKD